MKRLSAACRRAASAPRRRWPRRGPSLVRRRRPLSPATRWSPPAIVCLASRPTAVAFIKLLSGRTHAVYTAVTVRWQGREYSFIERTLVRFCDIPEQEIERYADTPEPYDKAGGYGIQGRAAVWTTGISGCYYNVMGLPVAHLAAKLREIGAL